MINELIKFMWTKGEFFFNSIDVKRFFLKSMKKWLWYGNLKIRPILNRLKVDSIFWVKVILAKFLHLLLIFL
jgi:hypothetical protein